MRNGNEEPTQTELALISVRQLAKTGFAHVFVTRHMGDGNTISLNTREYNYYFPLHIYDDDGQATLEIHPTLNLTSTFVSQMCGTAEFLKPARFEAGLMHRKTSSSMPMRCFTVWLPAPLRGVSEDRFPASSVDLASTCSMTWPNSAANSSPCT